MHTCDEQIASGPRTALPPHPHSVQQSHSIAWFLEGRADMARRHLERQRAPPST